jgi:DNA-binding response OmpR family regulator
MSKLLLVEDDNNLREIYEARLQAEGYTIVTAKDGEEALAVAKAEKPDLIISDVMMPKISGFEMLDIIKNTDGLKNVRVIMLTALGQNDDQQRANNLGADRYLVKSQVTLEDIVRTAHELLEDQPSDSQTSSQAPTVNPATPSENSQSNAIPPPQPLTTPQSVNTPSMLTTDPSNTISPSVQPANTASSDQTPQTSSASSLVNNPISVTPETITSSQPLQTVSQGQENLNNIAQQSVTSSNEEATLQSQITDFVNSMPTATSTESTTPLDPTTTMDNGTAQNNSQLIDQAVNDLNNSGPLDMNTAVSTPSTSSSTTSLDADDTIEQQDSNEKISSLNNSSVKSMSHEKVITPTPNSELNNKPDIQALLAAEEAKGESLLPSSQFSPTNQDSTNIPPAQPGI